MITPKHLPPLLLALLGLGAWMGLLTVAAIPSEPGVSQPSAVQTAIGTEGDSVDVLMDAGREHLEADRPVAAEAAFRRALELGAGARALNGLGVVYAAQPGREKKAESSFRRALKEDPQSVETQYNLARLYARWRPKRAIRAYERVLQVQPDHPDAAAQIGSLHLSRKQPREALRWFQKQLETNPDNVTALTQAGRLLIRFGDREEGVIRLERAVGIEISDGGPAHVALALARIGQERFNQADALFRAYLGTLPDSVRSAFNDPALVASRDQLAVLNFFYEDTTESGQPRVSRQEAHRRYWKMMDPTPLTEVNERLLTHYRRVAYAHRHYPGPNAGMDRRGQVYVRYGEPDHVSRWDDIQIERDRDVQDVRIEFANRSHVGFRIPPGQPIFPVSPTSRWEYWIYADVDGGIELTFVKEFDALGYGFAPFPRGLGVGIAAELAKLQPAPVLRDAALRVPTAYRVEMAELPARLHLDTAGFKADGGRSRLEVYSGLPAAEAARLRDDDERAPIVLERGVVLFDSLWTEAYRSADQVSFDPPTEQQILDDAFLPGILSLDLDPGNYLMALQVKDAGSGASRVFRREIVVPDFHAPQGPKLSDIQLAFTVSPTAGAGSYVKHGLRVVPRSSRTFRSDQSAFLYFEIYDLARDELGRTRYRVEYRIRSAPRRSAPARILHGLGRVLRVSEKDRELAVSYEHKGELTDEVSYVELDLKASDEGDQQVKVTVTDLVADRSAERIASFFVTVPK